MNLLTRRLSSTEGAASRKPEYLWVLIKVAFVAGVVGVFLQFIDLGELVVVFSGVNLWPLPPVLVLIYLDRALSAYKWRLLLKAIGVQAPFSVLMRIYFVAPLVGLLFPAAVARDGFRFFMLSRYKVDKRSVLASIIAERVIGFVAILCLVVVSLGIGSYLFRAGGGYFRETELLLLAGMVVAVLLVGIALGGFKRFVDWLAQKLSRVPLVGTLHRVYSLYSEYRNHLGTVGRVLAMTFVEQMLPVLIASLLALALGIDATLLELFAVIPVILLVARLPLPLEGIGITEGLAVLLLGLLGVSPAEAVSLSLLARVTDYIAAAPIAAYFVLRGKQSLIPEGKAEVQVS